jgi:nucleoid-associated protein YgaU
MKKWFSSTEELISMFLGLVIVVVIIGLIINFFRKQRGNVEVPGISNVPISEVQKIEPTVVPKQTTVTYEVKKGDSLWKIAQNNLGSGYKWTEIAKLNNLKNPGLIYLGQKLILKSVEVVIPGQGSITGNSYVVVKGDSLWKIAVRAYGDGFKWTSIWNANKKAVIVPNKLFTGTKLVIPRDSKSP